MGKMFDNARAWWNSISDNFSDPGKLAQLSVADLEKAIKKAKEAAASVVGQPAVMEAKLKDLQKTDAELTQKITTLVKTGETGVEAAKKYVERQVTVRKELQSFEEDYTDAKEAAEEWKSKIRVLENALYSRRMEADKLQTKYETAKAEQQLGKQMQNADSLMGSDTFSALQSRVDKEQAKAAGYSAMSGLQDKADEEKILRDAETDALMAQYLNQN